MINRPLDANALMRLSKNLRAGSRRAARQGNLKLAQKKFRLAAAYDRRLVALIVR